MFKANVVCGLAHCCVLASVVGGCSDEAGVRRRTTEAKVIELKRAEAAAQCQSVNKVIDFLVLQGRNDLTSSREGKRLTCIEFSLLGCEKAVEAMLESDKAKSQEFRAIIENSVAPDECRAEYEFAQKFGVEAFRAHRLLLNAAVDDAVAEAEDRPTVEIDSSRGPE